MTDEITIETTSTQVLEVSTAATGARGSSIRAGAGAPADSLGSNGDVYVSDVGGLYQKVDGAYVLLGSIAGADGADGVDGVNGTNGTDGADGADGADGPAIELQAGATHLQWRVVGDVDWIDLIAIADLKGADGADGAPGVDGSDGAPGVDGSDGADGSSVELQANATHLQWRLVGAADWIDLVALSAITGPAGADGADGAPGADGADGADGIGVPDPSAIADGQMLEVQSGALVYVDPPSGGTGATRTTIVHTTASLADGATEQAALTDAPDVASLLTVTADADCRVTLYVSDTHATADASREFGTIPTAGTDHGVLADMLVSTSVFHVIPVPKLFAASGGTVYVRVRNDSGATAAITVTLDVEVEVA